MNGLATRRVNSFWRAHRGKKKNIPKLSTYQPEGVVISFESINLGKELVMVMIYFYLSLSISFASRLLSASSKPPTLPRVPPKRAENTKTIKVKPIPFQLSIISLTDMEKFSA